MKIPALLAVGLLLIPPAWSAPVYSWTDAAGIIHFSETPPDDSQFEVTVRDIEPAPVAGTPAADDYYSVANQAARMEARRLERDRLRAEILKAEAEARRAEAAAAAAREQPAEPAGERATGYFLPYPYYPPYYGYRPYPDYRDHPHHPPQPVRRPARNKKLIVNPDKP